ncbi:GNAT family N-acetyltransferase [Plantactinospora sonchi]|uniref:GNAT family protein n=1 Tax=Plantactinospora sonchi TaxID=1544735 RepID=A0ABU7RWD6_9ACTN
MNVTRPATLDDAPALAELFQLNRDFLAPWEPIRPDGWFTVAGQRADLAAALDRRDQGTGLVHVILDDAGRVVGRIALNSIIRGALQSGSVGYWVSGSHNGRGLATAAVREIVRVAFTELGLHRLQAETLPHNTPSRRVLERNGFVRIGMAPEYLNIAGRWQDFVLYQLVNSAWTPPGQPEGN